MDVETTQSADRFYNLMAWLHANRKRILIGLTAIAVVALVMALSAWRKAAEDSDADAQFFNLPGVVGLAAHADPVAPSKLLELAQQHPRTSAGEYAQLLGAEKLFMAAKYPEAHQEFSKFLVDYPESSLVPEARMGVAVSIEAEGKTTEAIQKYQELLSGFPGETHIVSPAKLTLARLLEHENQPQLALTYYSQLAQSQNPYDPWAAEARERGQLLLAKHPELRKAESPPSQSPLNLPQSGVQIPSAAPAKAPAATQPAPAVAKPKSGLDLLQFPGSASNSPPK